MPTLAEQVRASLEAAQLEPQDAAAAALAVAYAEQIDAWTGSAEALVAFGPRLLTVLARLGCTPTSRAAKQAAPPAAAAASPLDAIKDEVKAQRERHRRGAA